MRDTLREYFTALGKWLWVLVADVLGIVQDQLLDIPVLRALPLDAWLGLFILFLIVANVSAFHKVRVQRDSLRRQLDERARARAVLTRLAQMRTEGVDLRNEGMRIREGEPADDWIRRAGDWEAAVAAEIQLLSPAQAELFRTRDWIQIRGISRQMPEDLRRTVNALSDETESLRQLIERLDQ